MPTRLIAFLVLAVISAVLPGAGAKALDGIPVPLDKRTLDLTHQVQIYREPDDRIQVSTAPGPDGIVRRTSANSRLRSRSSCANKSSMERSGVAPS